MLKDLIVIIVIAAIIIAAIVKLVSDRKKGVKCSGCPHSKDCSSKSLCSGSDSGEDVTNT